MVDEITLAQTVQARSRLQCGIYRSGRAFHSGYVVAVRPVAICGIPHKSIQLIEVQEERPIAKSGRRGSRPLSGPRAKVWLLGASSPGRVATTSATHELCNGVAYYECCAAEEQSCADTVGDAQADAVAILWTGKYCKTGDEANNNGGDDRAAISAIKAVLPVGMRRHPAGTLRRGRPYIALRRPPVTVSDGVWGAQPRAARGPAGGRTPRASACSCIGHSAARRRRRRLEQVGKV